MPTIIDQATFDAAQAQLGRNAQMARRNNTARNSPGRAAGSRGRCRHSCTGRCRGQRYAYYLCRGRSNALRAARGERCTARFIPAQGLDDLVWADLCRVLA